VFSPRTSGRNVAARARSRVGDHRVVACQRGGEELGLLLQVRGTGRARSDAAPGRADRDPLGQAMAATESRTQPGTRRCRPARRSGLLRAHIALGRQDVAVFLRIVGGSAPSPARRRSSGPRRGGSAGPSPAVASRRGRESARPRRFIRSLDRRLSDASSGGVISRPAARVHDLLIGSCTASRISLECTRTIFGIPETEVRGPSLPFPALRRRVRPIRSGSDQLGRGSPIRRL